MDVVATEEYIWKNKNKGEKTQQEHKLIGARVVVRVVHQDYMLELDPTCCTTHHINSSRDREKRTWSHTFPVMTLKDRCTSPVRLGS